MDSMIRAARSVSRLAAIAAVSLAALASSAAAGRLPRPLGAGHQLLSPGAHVLDLVLREQGGTGPAHLPRIALTLPSGWFNYDGWGMNDGGTLIVSFWDVASVYPTPCRWLGKPKIDPGPTVAGLASALATRPLRRASRPRDVVLGGFRGKYLRWSVPKGISFSRCGQGYFESWTATGWASDRYQQGPGQVDRLWILDVHGQRLVIDAAYMPSATRKQRAELDRIVHSIEFLPGSSRKLASAASGGRLARNGPWIAYSTTPACGVDSPSCTGGEQDSGGSDIFVTRTSGGRKLVAGRDGGRVWNVCPAFSPNGRMLAFVRVAGTTGWSEAERSTIVVVRIGPRSPNRAGRLALNGPASRAHCPRWSSDSSRLAYLSGGTVVVRGLDGKKRRWSQGDPTIRDLYASKTKVVSPTGALVASLDSANEAVVVSRPDGSERRVIPDDLKGYPSYAIGGWSPDGRKLLLMKDVGGFNMRAVSVDPPFASQTIVSSVRVNDPRSWPGYGDVSWQPMPRR